MAILMKKKTGILKIILINIIVGCLLAREIIVITIETSLRRLTCFPNISTLSYYFYLVLFENNNHN